MKHQIEVVTDTATLGIFDPASLTHRLKATGPWWSEESEALKEINKANLIVFGVPSDGTYDVKIHDGEAKSDGTPVHLRLTVPSGRLFIGGAEWITSEGDEPSERVGTLLDIEPGTYNVTITMSEDYEFDIALQATTGEAKNDRKKGLMFI